MIRKQSRGLSWALAGAAAAASLLALPARSVATVDFTFNFTDAAGFGFNANGQTGADRRAGLAQAAGYVSSVLGASYTATIIMDVNGSVTADTTLASASTNYNSAYPGEGFGTRGDVMLKILGGNGADPNAGLADGNIKWNFEDFNWEPLSDFQTGELDLISTAIHELTHAIGFASDINQNGSSSWGDAAGTPSSWAPFDQFVAHTDGTSLINGTTFALDGSNWTLDSVGGTGASGLAFNGANAVAAAGGLVYLYSPTTWKDGSSGSHLDTDFYDGTNGTIENMMNHASSHADGLDIRKYTAIEFGILKDIGYTNIVIPEPGAVAILLLGFGAMMTHRRRHA